ncbi:N-acetyltransferase family protein [Phytohabitans sp. LJ34]|uniref:GNAT family N-acetyltransferase n=1 Tax=Phytohabitans sp. LJ34 TaxID=3452217 RepID=UPI003F8B3082
MPTDLTVAPATPADLETVTTIYAHYVTDTVATFEQVPPTVEYWRQRMADLSGQGLPFLVARIGGETVGYAYASPWRPKPAYRYTVEDTIYLAPGWTGRGVGRALLERLLQDCAHAGVRQVIAVIADTGSDASAALHRRLGFADVGRLSGVGHKHGRWIDTALMQRTLR